MRAALFLSLLALPAAAYAEDEIIVTGHGLDEPAGEKVYDSVVITRDALTGSASGRLDNILNQVPGLQQFRRSDTRTANPTSQGVTLRALGGNASSRALLILDGVPQTDPFGGWINWPAYDPERLGSVRVVRGGGTGVYGPGALAGTIEMASAAPIDLAGFGADLAYGSRDSVDARASVGTALGAGFVSASAMFGRGDGFIPVVEEQRGAVDRPAPYEQGSLSLRGFAPLASDLELQANMLLFRDERERGVPFTDNVTKGADASLRLVGSGELPFSALVYLQTRDYFNSFGSIAAGRATSTQSAEQYSVPSTGIGARGELRPSIGPVELRFGADWRRTTGETREKYNFQNGVGTRNRLAGGRTDTLGGFAEAAYEAGPWTLTGGGRIDHWWIADGHLDERVFATGQVLTNADFPNRSGWEPTGRAGIAFTPVESVTLRAAGYLGWRLPTLNELYRPFRVGADATAANANLDPERLRGIEGGIEVRPAEGARIGVTVFTNHLKNAIANVTLGRGPGTFPGVGFVPAGALYSQRQNLDAVDATGVEADASFAIGAWTLGAGYSFVDAEVDSSGPAAALDGLRPAQTPRHSASASIGWHGPSGLRASVSALYSGSRFEDDLNTQRLDDALSFDAVAEVPISGGLAIQARGENLTNERIEAGVDGNGIVERATPRTLWIGLSWRG